MENFLRRRSIGTLQRVHTPLKNYGGSSGYGRIPLRELRENVRGKGYLYLRRVRRIPLRGLLPGGEQFLPALLRQAE